MQDTETRMEVVEIKRSKRLKGTVAPSGDRGLALFALLLGALSKGATRLDNLPDPAEAPWLRELLADLEEIGFGHTSVDGHLLLTGTGEAPRPRPEALHPRHELELLALAGFLAGHRSPTPLKVDPAVVPAEAADLMLRLFDCKEIALPALPAPEGDAAGETLPIRYFSVTGARDLAKPPAADGQPLKAALLFHRLAARQELRLSLKRPGPDGLERLVALFEAPLSAKDGGAEEEGQDELARRIARQLRAAGKAEPEYRLHLPAGARPQPQFLRLPGDATETAAYALAATLIKGSDLALEGVYLNTARTAFLAALRRMGADIEITQRREKFGDSLGNLRVRPAELLGKRFGADNLAGMRDELPLLIVAAAFAEGETVIRDIGWLRGHGRDLLKDMIQSLKAAGVEIGEVEDGMVLRGRQEYDGGDYQAHGHPALGLAYLVLALKSHGTSRLRGLEGVERRFPGVAANLARLAAAEAG